MKKIVMLFILIIFIWFLLLIFISPLAKRQQSEIVDNKNNIQSNISDDCCSQEKKEKGYTCVVMNCPGPPIGPREEYMGSKMSFCIFPGNATDLGEPFPVCPT